MTLVNMTAEETLQQNTDHCRHIADQLTLMAAERLYECPYCGTTIDVEEIDDLSVYDAVIDGEEITCKCCEKSVELERVDVYKWLESALDIEYTVSSRFEYLGATVCVTLGGPSIYVDTRHRSVNLYWWADRASWSLSGSAADMLDEALAEYFEISR